MTRDYAAIQTSIWGNPTVRALPPMHQWLYILMWTHPGLSYAGVLDWRPERNLAPLSAGVSADEVRSLIPVLEGSLFVILDEQTEEILLRSYFRHDGVMKNPKTAVSMANAYAAIGSATIRGVIIHELHRLRDEHPDWKGWTPPQVVEILKHPSVDPRSLSLTDPITPSAMGSDSPSSTPSVRGSVTPSVRGKPTPSVTPCPTTTSTTTATDSLRHGKRDDVSERDFERAWTHWPKKTERKKSLEKFRQVARHRGVELTIADIVRFGDAYARSTEKQFVPALNVWLNRERWTDELPAAATGNAPAYVVEPEPPAGKRWAVDVMDGDFDVQE